MFVLIRLKHDKRASADARAPSFGGWATLHDLLILALDGRGTLADGSQ
jgi:hypothetical protein